MAKNRAYFFANRNTAVIAPSAKVARQRKQRGGDKIVATRDLSAADTKKANRGEWVRTRRDGKSPSTSAYGKGQGQGPKRKGSS